MAEVGLGEALSYGTDYKPSGNMPITKGLMMREQNALKKATLEAKAATAESSGINKIAKYINGIEANKKFDKGDLRDKLHEYAIDATYKVYNSSNPIEAQNHVNDFVKKVGELESIQANRNEHTAFLNANPSLMLNKEHALAAKNGGETYFKYMEEHPEENSPYMFEQQTGYTIPAPDVRMFKAPTNHEKEFSDYAQYALRNKDFQITSNPSGNGFVVFSPSKKLNEKDIEEMANDQFGKSINEGKYKTSDLYNYYIYNGGDELKNRLKDKTGEARINEAFNYAKEQYVKDINKVASQKFNPKILTDPTLRNNPNFSIAPKFNNNYTKLGNLEVQSTSSKITLGNNTKYDNDAAFIKKGLGMQSSDNDVVQIEIGKDPNKPNEGADSQYGTIFYSPKTNKYVIAKYEKGIGGEKDLIIEPFEDSRLTELYKVIVNKNATDPSQAAELLERLANNPKNTKQKQNNPPPQGTGGGGSKPTRTHKINLGAGN